MTTERHEGQTLRFFLDTEFNDELGDFRIELISIALVSENGEREFYAESAVFSEDAAHPWLREHVLPKLGPKAQRQPLEVIRDGILGYFEKAVRAGAGSADKIQIWAKNGANDITIMGLLFGGMAGFYRSMNALGIERSYFNDTDMLRRQVRVRVTSPARPADQLHHALWDARNERQEYQALQRALAAQTGNQPYSPS